MGHDHRYDMVLEVRDRFLRVQCKTGRLRNGAVEFRPQSTRSNTRGVYNRSYIGEVEYFAVHCPATHGVYVVPCDETTRSYVALRQDPAINNQSKRIRWAADYEIERFEP